MNQAKEMARIAYEALSEKKGEDIKVIDISGISVLADLDQVYTVGLVLQITFLSLMVTVTAR